jgi:hypothetical protein
LKKISVQGGAPVTLCDALAAIRGGSWGEDGNIIAALSSSGSLSRIPADGGMPEPLTKLDRADGAHRWPQIIPGSDAVLFTAVGTAVAFEEASIEVFSWKTGQRKTLVRGGYFGRYVPTRRNTGHLIYMHEATLFGAPFDPRPSETGRHTHAGARRCRGQSNRWGGTLRFFRNVLRHGDPGLLKRHSLPARLANGVAG